MPKNGETKERVGIVYQINIDGKIYIGLTVQPLKDRIRSHVRDAINGKSNKPLDADDTLPFIKPTQNFTGKSSVIKRIMTRHNDWQWLQNESKRKQVKWLFERVMAITTVLHEVECISTYIKLKGKSKGRWETDKDELHRLEKIAIKAVWIEDPRSLLNYAGRPLQKHFENRLRENLNKDLERIRKDTLCSEEDQIKMITKNRRSNYRKEQATINRSIKIFEQWTPFERAEYLYEHELAEQIKLELESANADF
jgi:hypothetical protein